MNWGKVNLVTVSDKAGMYDLLKCKDCGFQKKYYGFQRPGRCPKCKNVASEGKNIIGCWTHKSRFGISDCPICGAILILTPKEGHRNSKYWNLQRDDDELLLCCPNNCTEK